MDSFQGVPDLDHDSFDRPMRTAKRIVLPSFCLFLHVVFTPGCICMARIGLGAYLFRVFVSSISFASIDGSLDAEEKVPKVPDGWMRVRLWQFPSLLFRAAPMRNDDRQRPSSDMEFYCFCFRRLLHGRRFTNNEQCFHSSMASTKSSRRT